MGGHEKEKIVYLGLHRFKISQKIWGRTLLVVGMTEWNKYHKISKKYQFHLLYFLSGDSSF